MSSSDTSMTQRVLAVAIDVTVSILMVLLSPAIWIMKLQSSDKAPSGFLSKLSGGYLKSVLWIFVMIAQMIPLLLVLCVLFLLKEGVNWIFGGST